MKTTSKESRIKFLEKNRDTLKLRIYKQNVYISKNGGRISDVTLGILSSETYHMKKLLELAELQIDILNKEL